MTTQATTRLQRNQVLLNLLSQLVYSPDEFTADRVASHLGITRSEMLMGDKRALNKAILRGLLDTTEKAMIG